MKLAFNSFEKFVKDCTRWMSYIAYIALSLMVLFVVADIIGNKLFKTPVPGGIEFVSLLSVIAISFAIAQTQIEHGHIEVEMLVRSLPRKAQKIIAVCVHLCSIALFIVLSVMSFKYGASLQAGGEVSMTLGLPFYPFIWGIGVSSIFVILVLIMQLWSVLRKN